jgi:hypothetical protein
VPPLLDMVARPTLCHGRLMPATAAAVACVQSVRAMTDTYHFKWSICDAPVGDALGPTWMHRHI